MHNGEITTWHDEVQWGFATTQEGKKFFVHKSAFHDHRQIAGVRFGTRIEFEELPRAAQTLLDKLNTGKYRDEPTIARNHRNPRRVVIKNKKPRATNVWVVRP